MNLPSPREACGYPARVSSGSSTLATSSLRIDDFSVARKLRFELTRVPSRTFCCSGLLIPLRLKYLATSDSDIFRRPNRTIWSGHQPSNLRCSARLAIACISCCLMFLSSFHFWIRRLYIRSLAMSSVNNADFTLSMYLRGLETIMVCHSLPHDLESFVFWEVQLGNERTPVLPFPGSMEGTPVFERCRSLHCRFIRDDQFHDL